MQKTNAMRLLDRAGVDYETLGYEYDENDLSGVAAAKKLGLPPGRVFKTLVARGDKTGFIVCVLPVDREIDLKRLAKASDNKRVELIAQKELLPITGYERGGCSPFGMKKSFPTYIDATAGDADRICVSGGRRGVQVYLDPRDLIRLLGAHVYDNDGQ